MKLSTEAIGLTILVLVLMAWIGVALQSLSFPLVWSLPGPVWWPFSNSTLGEVLLGVLAVGLTWGALGCVFQRFALLESSGRFAHA